MAFECQIGAGLIPLSPEYCRGLKLSSGETLQAHAKVGDGFVTLYLQGQLAEKALDLGCQRPVHVKGRTAWAVFETSNELITRTVEAHGVVATELRPI